MDVTLSIPRDLPDVTLKEQAFRRVLPRRRCPRAHADRGLLPFGDNNERWLNLHRGLAQGVNHCEHERRGDVSRTQVDDSDERRSGADRRTAEG